MFCGTAGSSEEMVSSIGSSMISLIQELNATLSQSHRCFLIRLTDLDTDDINDMTLNQIKITLPREQQDRGQFEINPHVCNRRIKKKKISNKNIIHCS